MLHVCELSSLRLKIIKETGNCTSVLLEMSNEESVQPLIENPRAENVLKFLSEAYWIAKPQKVGSLKVFEGPEAPPIGGGIVYANKIHTVADY